MFTISTNSSSWLSTEPSPLASPLVLSGSAWISLITSGLETKVPGVVAAATAQVFETSSEVSLEPPAPLEPVCTSRPSEGSTRV